jgi:hypothetical protein
MPGTFSEHFTMQQLNLDTNKQSKIMQTNITHTSAHAPMMSTTCHNFSETATQISKQFLATALKRQAEQSLKKVANELYFNENFYKSNTILFQFLCSLF